MQRGDKINQKKLKEIIKKYGERYSKILEIDVDGGKEREIFKWWLAAILFGAPIQEKNAIKTYKKFEEARVISAQKILETGWQGLVNILDSGGYTRYDFKTADKLLEMSKNLTEKHKGKLSVLKKKSENETKLRENLKALAKGIGNATVEIFLREMRVAWKVKPKFLKFEKIAMKKLKIKKSDFEKLSEKNKIKLQTALMRIGREIHKKFRKR